MLFGVILDTKEMRKGDILFCLPIYMTFFP